MGLKRRESGTGIVVWCFLENWTTVCKMPVLVTGRNVIRLRWMLDLDENLSCSTKFTFEMIKSVVLGERTSLHPLRFSKCDFMIC